jgi:hypothetical protein
MSQRDFTQLLTTLDALSPEQMETLRRELDSKMASAMPSAMSPPAQPPPSRATPMSEDDFKRQLLKSGLMTSLPTPADPAARPVFQPIAIDGEPLSETIIRERR